MAWFAWALMVYGMTTAVTKAKVTYRLRRSVLKRSPFLGEGIACPMCVGFWMGLLVGLVWPMPGLPPAPSVVLPFASAFGGLAVCWLLSAFNE